MSPAAASNSKNQRHQGVAWLLAAPLAVGLMGLLGGCDEQPQGEAARPIKNPTILGSLGDTPGRFAYPRCIDHDDAALWVIDKSARVQRIDPQTGGCLAIFQMPDWNLGKPTGFCVAPGPDASGGWHDSLLWIADTHYHRVMVYKAEGGSPVEQLGTPQAVAQWGSYGTGPGQFIYPTDVVVTYKPAGAGGKPAQIDRIYVSEYGGNDRVSVFDASHEFLFSFGREGTGSDPAAIEFNRPQSMTIRQKPDGSSEIIVVDSCNHRVGRFTPDGKLLGWVGRAPVSAGGSAEARGGVELKYPYGVAMLADGTAMISEFGGARVQRIDLDAGRSLGAWGEPGREPGQLLAPWALTVMNSSVYLLDSGNNRIVAWKPR